MLDWVVSPDSQVISQVVSQPITKGTKVRLAHKQRYHFWTQTRTHVI